MISSAYKERFVDKRLTREEQKRLDQAFANVNSAGFDNWGVSPDTLKGVLSILRKLYTDYFRVETVGMENIPSGRVLLIGNHGGQLPIDGMLVNMAVILEGKPPRMVRAMVERWSPTVPFLGTWMNRCGQVVGNYRNCRELLEKDECILVFPEGVRGSAKTIFHRYQLQRFGTGFVRVALETNTPIVPVSIIGCEETVPSVYDSKTMGRILGAPFAPITPFFPWLGPIGLIPLPCKVTIRFGQPMRFTGDHDGPETEIEKMAGQVKATLQAQISEGVKKRGGRIFTGAAK